MSTKLSDTSSIITLNCIIKETFEEGNELDVWNV